jgi:glycosyltransferase involved in cell wall biosynthesis/ADP-heptose:LPS heptosyltransferase
VKTVILRNSFSPGDIVLLTAAVRDLHLSYPSRFLTDVRTPYPQLWENNPYLTPLDEKDPAVEVIDCHYPLINRSNRAPYHVIHGFIEFLNERLNLRIKPSAFKGDIHISDLEKQWYSQVYELTGEDTPFWIIVAGGKYDVTIKWWEARCYQQVVDHFKGRIQFVQVGASDHFHPGLKDVIDLRGQTDLRQLVRLVYHAQGVLCPVTMLMHLAAAVEVRGGIPQHRSCVVVAGGREPAHWEAYPHHQFIHTGGSLLCCDNGGCWKSRVLPLGDGDERDRPENLCVDVAGDLPKCMDMITADEVIGHIERYFEGGAISYLTPKQAETASIVVTKAENRLPEALNIHTARAASEHFITTIPKYPGRYRGRGIVICGGGETYFICAWVCVKMLRLLGCDLPVQLWHLGPGEVDAKMKRIIRRLDVECVDGLKMREKHPARVLKGWELKPYAILHSPFREVLLLDADNVPVENPEFLFDTPQFKEFGAIFWPDFGRLRRGQSVWDVCGVPYQDEPAFESGQIVIDKKKCWRALCLTMWYNEHSDFYYQHVHGDKDTFHLAFRKLNQPYAMPEKPIHALERTMCQHDFEGRRIFQHRNGDKWSLTGNNRAVWGFLYEKECRQHIDELRQLWKGAGNVPRYTPEKKKKRLKKLAEELTRNLYEYRRVGFDRRKMEFLADGRIGLGGGGCERFWDLVEDKGKVALLISADRAITARLALQDGGIWRGRWIRHEKMPLVITPLARDTKKPVEFLKKIDGRPRRAMKRNQVLFRAPLNGYTGYGLHACQIVTDLQQMGYDVKVRAVVINETFGPIPLNVRHNIVSEEQKDEWELLLHPPGHPCVAGKKTIYFTMWESTRLPANSVPMLNDAQCVIVPTHWNASCFSASGVEKPIRVVPLGINTKVFHCAPMNMDGPCVFGTAGRMESGGVRKGIGQVIKLFQRAFPTEQDVRLRVKVFPDCDVAKINDPRIEFIHAYMTEEDLARWFSEITCFVSAAKGEGWGLMQHQALAVGRPLISVRYGGVAEFFTAEMGYPVDFKLVPSYDFYSGCGLWAEPDEQHMIELMHTVYADRDTARRLGLNGAAMAAQFSWQKSSRGVVQVLREFGMVA